MWFGALSGAIRHPWQRGVGAKTAGVPRNFLPPLLRVSRCPAATPTVPPRRATADRFAPPDSSSLAAGRVGRRLLASRETSFRSAAVASYFALRGCHADRATTADDGVCPPPPPNLRFAMPGSREWGEDCWHPRNCDTATAAAAVVALSLNNYN